MPINFQQSGSDIYSRFVPKWVFNQGQLWAAGTNYYNSGTLGNGQTTTKYSSPVQVATGGINWIARPNAVAGTFGAGAAIKSDGTLWTWGKNYHGSLGQGDTSARLTPTQVGSDKTWISVHGQAGGFKAIKADTSMWSWGENSYAQAGVGVASAHQSNPAQVDGYGWKMATNAGTSGYATKLDGSLWAFGRNWLSALGGIGAALSTPVQIGTDRTWKEVRALSQGGAIALKTDGTLWSWTYYQEDAAGTNDRSQYTRTSPVQVGSDTTWARLSLQCNATAGAIKTDGSLWAWGYNGGNFGNGSTVSTSSPVQVGTSYNWKYASFYNGCWGVKTDGTMWTWGPNGYGQAGQGSSSTILTPVQLGTETNWVAAASGYSPGQTYFLKSIT
jgi:alpha-tubulin suppressor-like RCC1 family protein